MNFDAFGETEEERLFKEAMALPESEQRPFLESATDDRPHLRKAVMQLLEGSQRSAREGGGTGTRAGNSDGAPTIGSGLPQEVEEEVGTVIRGYILCRKIGSGGMGSVWLAEQREPVKRFVALKLIKLGMDTLDLVRRFDRERQTLARLQHPHIAQVYDAGATPSGRPFFVMEYVEGEPIHDWCAERQLGTRERLALFRDVCAAIEHAHTKGVIHRDLKPSNILVDEQGQVKVIDFGIAKLAGAEGYGSETLTQATQVVGTPAYMSPEQAAGGRGVDVDTRTDVYSLGAVLYELLAGKPPFDSKRLATTPISELRRILREETPLKPSTRADSAASGTRVAAKPSAANGTPGPKAVPAHELRGDLDWITLKALEKEPGRRYRSAADLSDDIARFLDGHAVRAVPPSRLYRTRKFVRRNRLVLAALTGIFLALAAGLGFSLRQLSRANEASAAAVSTLTDLQAGLGSSAAERGRARDAALFFATAAETGERDPAQRRANRIRSASYGPSGLQVVRAVEIPIAFPEQLEWHPSGIAIAVGFRREGVVVDLEREQFWTPPATPGSTNTPAALGQVSWHPNGHLLASLRDFRLRIFAYPSGELVHDFADKKIPSFRWSPDGKWLAASGRPPLLWEVASGQIRTGSQAITCHHLNWSPLSDTLVVEGGKGCGIVPIDSFDAFRFAPVPVSALGWLQADFAVENGGLFYLNGPAGVEVRSSTEGVVLREFPYPEDKPIDSAGIAIGTDAAGRIVRREGGLIDLHRAGVQSFPFPVAQNYHETFAFAPDGRHFLAATKDGRVRRWDLASEQAEDLLDTFGNATSLAFSPDGRHLATGEEFLLRIWAVREPAGQTVRNHQRPTLCELAASPATTGPAGVYMREGGLQVNNFVTDAQWFDVATNEALGPALPAGGAILDAVMGPNAAWAAMAVSSIGADNPAAREQPVPGTVQLFDPRSGKRLGEPVVFEVEPRAVAVHPGGKILGVFCGDGSGWELAFDAAFDGGEIKLNKRALWPGGDYRNPNTSFIDGRCRYSADGSRFLAYGMFIHFHLWDRDAKRALFELDPESHCFDVDLHGDVACLAIAGLRSRLEFVDVQTGEALRDPLPLTGSPHAVRLSADGRHALVAVNESKLAQVWDWRAGVKAGPDLKHADHLAAACFVPGGDLWVATAANDLNLHLWEARSGRPLRPPVHLGGSTILLEVAGDGNTLVASGYLNGQLHFFDLQQLLADSPLDPPDLVRLGELNAAATLEGGGLSGMTRDEWLEAWRSFRADHPDFPGHGLGAVGLAPK